MTQMQKETETEIETKIEEILESLTEAEKISLLAGADMWHTVPVTEKGIPQMRVTDGPSGVRGVNDNHTPPSICFPVGVAIAATWNMDLVEKIGETLGEAVKAKGGQMLLAPTVNLHRSPLGGRSFECYSEDPYLAGKIAAAYIRGLQNEKISACIKHFVCNDSEFERFTISSEVNERPLRELYLEPFRIAIEESHPWAIMSAYNRINGVYASENNLTLLDILKGEWGYDGAVVSDWFGTYTEEVEQGGLELEMPGPVRWHGPTMAAKIASGEIDVARLDDKVRRLLRLMVRTELFERPPGAEEQLDTPAQRAITRQAAAEAIVLLKNDNNLLPLDPEKLKKIVVIGQNARWAQVMGGGSANLLPNYVVSPLDGIRAAVGDQVEVEYQFGCPLYKLVPALPVDWVASPEGEAGFQLEYFPNMTLDGEPHVITHLARTGLKWFRNSEPRIDAENYSARMRGYLTVPESGSYLLGLTTVGRGRLLVDGQMLFDRWDQNDDEAAVFEEMTAEMTLEAGRAYELVVEYAPSPESRWRTARLGILPPLPADPIQAAVEAARGADAVVLLAGLTEEWESEGRDREHMDLPGPQDELIRAVMAANPNTAVVLNSGSPVHMPWVDVTPTLLQAWYGGQEAGNGLADVLFGRTNPSGKLPLTLPKRYCDNPAYLNYPGENDKVYYGEGLFMGYRYYDKKEIEPLFPFGHGLSYTAFDYRSIKLSAETMAAEKPLEVTIEIANSGTRTGQEVIQLYLRDPKSRLVRPEKELKRFAKVKLAPGEVKKITFSLDAQALAYWDPAEPGWVAEPGTFEILAGRSSRDIRLQAAFEWLGADLGAGSAVDEMDEINRGYPASTT